MTARPAVARAGRAHGRPAGWPGQLPTPRRSSSSASRRLAIHTVTQSTMTVCALSSAPARASGTRTGSSRKFPPCRPVPLVRGDAAAPFPRRTAARLPGRSVGPSYARASSRANPDLPLLLPPVTRISTAASFPPGSAKEPGICLLGKPLDCRGNKLRGGALELLRHHEHLVVLHRGQTAKRRVACESRKECRCSLRDHRTPSRGARGGRGRSGGPFPLKGEPVPIRPGQALPRRPRARRGGQSRPTSCPCLVPSPTWHSPSPAPAFPGRSARPSPTRLRAASPSRPMIWPSPVLFIRHQRQLLDLFLDGRNRDAACHQVHRQAGVPHLLHRCRVAPVCHDDEVGPEGNDGFHVLGELVRDSGREVRHV